MTQDEIIEMAREALKQEPREDWNSTAWVFADETLQAFAKLVAAKEREALEAELLKLKKAQMTPEDEEFNRIEMESRIKQEYIRTMRKTTREEKISRPAVYEVPAEGVQFMSISVDDYLKLSEDLATARMLIRELGDRLAKLERGNEPATCPVCSATAYPYPKCGCVFYKEKNT